MKIVLLSSAIIFVLGIAPGNVLADETPAPDASPTAASSTIAWSHTAPPAGWYVDAPSSSYGIGASNTLGLNLLAKHDGEYARYLRTEPSGYPSRIFALHRSCPKCDVAAIAKVFADSTIHFYRSVTTSQGPMCGYPAVRVIAEGADPRNRLLARGVENTYFAIGDELVEFNYQFSSPPPQDNLEAAFASLCPSPEHSSD